MEFRCTFQLSTKLPARSSPINTGEVQIRQAGTRLFTCAIHTSIDMNINIHDVYAHFTDLCDSHSAQRSTTPLSVYVSKYCRIPIGRVVRDVRVLKLSTQIAWLLAQGITLCRLSVIVNAYTITLFELWTIFVHRHILLWVRGENNQARLIYYNTRRLNFMHNYIVRQ